jgi:hypothetical protein
VGDPSRERRDRIILWTCGLFVAGVILGTVAWVLVH